MIKMWFKSVKEFKENSETRMLLVITAWYTTYAYDNFEDSLNMNERAAFVDAWLSEPIIDKSIKLIPVVYMKDHSVFN